MKSFKLSKDSWHYKLAGFGGLRQHRDSSICEYFWRSVVGILLMTLATVIVIGFTVAMGFLSSEFAAFLWLWLVDGIWYFQAGAQAAFAVLCFIALCLAVWGSNVYSEHLKDKKRAKEWADFKAGVEPVVKEPGFVVQAYRSWKQKTCHKITFE